MTTPARSNFHRKSAQASAAVTDPGTVVIGGEYERMLVRLRNDLLRLKQIESVEHKAVVKRELLPEYAAWVSGVLAADSGAIDEILPNVMVWRIDSGDYEGALDIGDYVLRHGLPMPDRYNRGAAVVLAEEIAEQAIKSIKAGNPVHVPTLARTIEMTATRDMPDEARSKLFKAAGWALQFALVDEGEGLYGSVERAMAAQPLLERALQLHKKAGVVRDIEILGRYLKKHGAIVDAIKGRHEAVLNAAMAMSDTKTDSEGVKTGSPGAEGSAPGATDSTTPPAA
jgi:Phage small terminase subunit